MAKKQTKKNDARAEVDISANLPTSHDPFQPWPYTIPIPRSRPYGRPGETKHVLILPGKLEYDPCMALVEKFVRRLDSVKGFNVVIVVPDVWRGVGEIMARRNGLDYRVMNTDAAGATVLPSTPGPDKFADSKTARSRVLRVVDYALIVDNNVAAEKVLKDIEQRFQRIKIKVFKHLYVKKSESSVKPKKASTEKPKSKKRKK